MEGDKIKALGSQAAPANAKVIDLGDATLLPGFIDAHTITDEGHNDFYKDFHASMYRFAAEQSFYAAVYAKRTLEAGFTTIRNVGAGEFVDVGVRNADQRRPYPGPDDPDGGSLGRLHRRSLRSGPVPARSRGAARRPMDGVCNGADECRAAVRYQLKWGADVIKICSSGGVLSEADPVDVPQLTPDELNAIMSEAHAWKKVAAHAHGDLAARQAVEAGVDSIEHGSFLSDETLKLMKAKGTYLVPTRLAVWWVNQVADKFPPAIAAEARATLHEHERMFRSALKMGVPIAFGTDSGVSPHGTNAKEFKLLTDIGMQPAAALVSGTRESAKLLGIIDQVGTLEAGKIRRHRRRQRQCVEQHRRDRSARVRDEARRGGEAAVTCRWSS